MFESSSVVGKCTQLNGLLDCYTLYTQQHSSRCSRHVLSLSLSLFLESLGIYFVACDAVRDCFCTGHHTAYNSVHGNNGRSIVILSQIERWANVSVYTVLYDCI